VDDLVGQAELGSDGAHLVLEQRPQRLDELEVHVLGQAAHVVVALDGGGVLAAGLDDVGIQGALHQEARVLDAAGGVLEEADEQLADDLALGLGLGDAVELVEELVAGTHVDELDALERWKVSTTCSPSSLRIRPVSTNTHVSCGPMALCTSAAATAESTPPERPQMARPSPTWARMASTCSSMTLAMVQVRSMPARSRKRSMTAWPWGVWETSGWYCTP
jgi:hypothetical protein